MAENVKFCELDSISFITLTFYYTHQTSLVVSFLGFFVCVKAQVTNEGVGQNILSCFCQRRKSKFIDTVQKASLSNKEAYFLTIAQLKP